MRFFLGVAAAVAMFGAAIAIVGALMMASPAHARWTGPSDPALHAWFDGLASGKGLCCSFADGVAIEDVDWGTEQVTLAGGQSIVTYWVMLNGQKIVVPPEAVVAQPNKFGRAVVWPYQDANGATQIRCFLPGAGA